MTSIEQAYKRQTDLYNDIIAGFAKGLYDLFEDSALAVADTVGEGILSGMEDELGLSIQGQNPQEILSQIESILLKDYIMAEGASFTFDETQGVEMKVHRCMMWKATEHLVAQDIPPYTCVPMMMASAALHKRLKTKSKLTDFQQEVEKQACYIKFSI